MKICKAESCDYESKVEGLCYSHYKRFRRIGRTELYERKCHVEGCENKHASKGLCTKHYTQVRREEKAASEQTIIYKNGNWKIQDESDYVPIRN